MEHTALSQPSIGQPLLQHSEDLTIVIEEGHKYLSYKEYEKAHSYYIKALELLGKPYSSYHGDLLNRIGVCKIYLLQFEAALQHFKLVFDHYFDLIDASTQLKIIYNTALCYRKLEHFDLCLQFIESKKQYIQVNYREPTFVKINILLGNCYVDQCKLDEAIALYLNLISQIDAKEHASLLATVYNNLGWAFQEKNDFDKSMEYYNLAQNMRSSFDRQRLPHTFYSKAELYVKFKLYSDAVILLEIASDLSTDYYDIEFLKKEYNLLEKIAKIYKDLGNLEAALSIQETLQRISVQISLP